ncbi:MAG: polyketide synthase dehydratase domain-containing protein [Lentisphaeria bacterium]|nr:polyketide synthase dehydratase domain-containing protein [Lentisphaeria bacterium]
MKMNECVSIIGEELRSRIAGLRQTGEGEYSCTMDFDPAFRGFEGHFEGNPIVPGVCLIETARVAAETILGKSLETLIVTNCRFRRPVMASEQAAVKIKLQKLEETRWKVKADIRVGSDICAQLQLKAAEL